MELKFLNFALKDMKLFLESHYAKRKLVSNEYNLNQIISDLILGIFYLKTKKLQKLKLLKPC